MNLTEDSKYSVNDWLGISFTTLISATGVVLNFLSICGILGCKPLRKWKNVFIFNLSLSDCVSSFGILIQNAHQLRPKDQTRLPWAQPMFNTGMILSILSTSAIALQRFIIVRFDPVGRRHIITPCRSVSVCMITWLTFAALYALGYYLEGSEGIVSRIATSVIIWTALLITVPCYIWIYRRIASSAIFIGHLDGLSEKGVNVNKRIIITFSLVIASTILCWMPMSLVLLLEGLGIFEDERKWVSSLSRITFNLLCLNQVINPIIYWFRLTEFRDRLRICGGRRRHSEQDMEMSKVTLDNDLEGNKLIHS